jgi:hypothetical protein
LLSKKEADQPQIISTKKLSLLNPRNLVCLTEMGGTLRDALKKMVGDAAGILNGKIVVGPAGLSVSKRNFLRRPCLLASQESQPRTSY